MFKAGVIVSRSRELKSSLPTRAQGKLLVASGQIRGLAPTTLDKTYLASQLIQATLDHANPKVIRPCG